MMAQPLEVSLLQLAAQPTNPPPFLRIRTFTSTAYNAIKAKEKKRKRLASTRRTVSQDLGAIVSRSHADSDVIAGRKSLSDEADQAYLCAALVSEAPDVFLHDKCDLLAQDMSLSFRSGGEPNNSPCRAPEGATNTLDSIGGTPARPLSGVLTTRPANRDEQSSSATSLTTPQTILCSDGDEQPEHQDGNGHSPRHDGDGQPQHHDGNGQCPHYDGDGQEELLIHLRDVAQLGWCSIADYFPGISMRALQRRHRALSRSKRRPNVAHVEPSRRRPRFDTSTYYRSASYTTNRTSTPERYFTQLTPAVSTSPYVVKADVHPDHASTFVTSRSQTGRQGRFGRPVRHPFRKHPLDGYVL